ncbi:spermatogenesis-associated protein 7-like [Anneissia japonica]|uniref:spermatogenesis-associated protein 7-like n=1 Tax=Anneissia japonica TaxID=1529436 RepID=UPI00142554E2|nr:spermatogenesis-associated protein 7-like [Anneissia japonica]
MASRKKPKEEAFTKLPPRHMVTPTKGPYKGHVSVKSSVYASTGCTRLVSQNMVRDHLDAHYRRVNSAKSCIDNQKPKAWTNSTKKNDQLKRHKIKQTGNSRPSSRASNISRNSNLDQDDDFEFKELDFDETETGHGLSSNSRPLTNNRAERTMTPSERVGLTQRSSTPRHYSGDVLDTMSTSFVAPARPYTPRTKKSSAQSWLSKSNVYNSPRKNASSQKRSRKTSEVNGIKGHDDFDNSVKYKNGLNETFDNETEATMATVEGYRETSGWMSDDVENNIGYDNEVKPLYNSTIKHQRLNSEKAIQSSLKIQQEEEELLYLEFVTDVTTDVLNRGVYTNRMLKQIFESHIKNNKDRLDESRMQNLVQQLQQDLAIEDEEDVIDEVGDAAAGVSEDIKE